MRSSISTSFAAALAFLEISLAGCATYPPPDYDGDDVGYVVVGIGARTGTEYSSYELMFREVGKEDSDSFVYFQKNNFYSQGDDYATDIETGVVNVRGLAPGKYEIFNIDIFFNNGFNQTNFYLDDDISIPFTVRPGAVTYLGNFQANQLTGENIFGMPLPAGAYFVVTDRESEDINIAKGKQAKIAGKAMTNEFAANYFESLPHFQLTSETFGK